MKLLSVWALAALAAQAAGAAISHKLNGLTITEHPDPVKRALLQKYVGGQILARGLALRTDIWCRSPGMRIPFLSMASD